MTLAMCYRITVIGYRPTIYSPPLLYSNADTFPVTLLLILSIIIAIFEVFSDLESSRRHAFVQRIRLPCRNAANNDGRRIYNQIVANLWWICLCLCLSVCRHLEKHIVEFIKFLCMFVFVRCSIGGGVAVRYVLPVCGWINYTYSLWRDTCILITVQRFHVVRKVTTIEHQRNKSIYTVLWESKSNAIIGVLLWWQELGSRDGRRSVSYTHLTLPTILRV